MRMPCKSSHTALGGLQSDSICQHHHREVSRTVYLRDSWRVVRMVHSVLVPTLEQGSRLNGCPPSVQLSQPARSVCRTVQSTWCSQFILRKTFIRYSPGLQSIMCAFTRPNSGNGDFTKRPKLHSQYSHFTMIIANPSLQRYFS